MCAYVFVFFFCLAAVPFILPENKIWIFHLRVKLTATTTTANCHHTQRKTERNVLWIAHRAQHDLSSIELLLYCEHFIENIDYWARDYSETESVLIEFFSHCYFGLWFSFFIISIYKLTLLAAVDCCCCWPSSFTKINFLTPNFECDCKWFELVCLSAVGATVSQSH